MISTKLPSVRTPSTRRRTLEAPIFSMSLVALAVAVAGSAQAAGPALPNGGKVVAGQATIGAPAGGALTVNQSSGKAIINWQDFSIGQGGKVQFNNGSGATLNRVTGAGASSLDGLLSATGSVYLLNPNGVIIGKSGVVNVGGTFVASTQALSDDNFLKGGDLVFSGSSKAAVVNLGSVGALGGDVVLIASRVDNEGSITAPGGGAGLVAGYTVAMRDARLDGGRFSVVTGGSDTSVTNGGAILAANAELRAAGGDVYALAGNTAGVIRAVGVKAGQGKVWLVADGGTLDVAGTISAQGAGGAGGAIETSGSNVHLGQATIDAHGGAWSVDPVDLTIDATAAATITTALNGGTSVTEQTTATGSSGAGSPVAGAGDIVVAAPINWSSTAGLTLSAYHDVDVDADITASGGGTLKIVTDSSGAGNGGRLNLTYTDLQGLKHPSSIQFTGLDTTGRPTGALNINGHGYTLVNSVAALASAVSAGHGAGYYALATDADGSNGGAGFTASPIGAFSGTLQGLGNTITNLTISAPNSDAVGLIGTLAAAGVIDNVGLESGSVSGRSSVGALVGQNAGLISNISADVLVSGRDTVGGLVGTNTGTLDTVAAGGFVTGGGNVGGLVGSNIASPSSSGSAGRIIDATGAAQVLGSGANIGGLVGYNGTGAAITYRTTGSTVVGAVMGDSRSSNVGGVAGYNDGLIQGAIFQGSVVNDGTATGGVAGLNFTNGVLETDSALGYQVAVGLGVVLEPLQIQGAGATGGLVGKNYGLVSHGTTSIVAVTGADGVGGVAGLNYGAIQSSRIAGSSTVAGANYVGGLVGWNTSAKSGAASTATVSDGSYTGASTQVTGTGLYVGGLAGRNDAGAVIRDVPGDGNGGGFVTGSGLEGSATGGLVGYNAGSIFNASTGAVVVEAAENGGASPDYLGGAVGYNAATGVLTSVSTGPSGYASLYPGEYKGVTGAVAGSLSQAGGLAGFNAGTITASSSGDSVSTTLAGGVAGGLVGYNAAGGVIGGSSVDAAGRVTVAATSGLQASMGGGLIGANLGAVSDSSSAANVGESGASDASAASSVGGLVGYNAKGATLTNTYALGSVSGQETDAVGGLVARNYGAVTGSSAAGDVSLTGTASGQGGWIGGLVGVNYGVIGSATAPASFATGAITATGNGAYVGGLVGLNGKAGDTAGSITQAYASGSVTDTSGTVGDLVGGLVGANQGALSYVYEVGAVTGQGSRAIGGLIGQNASGATVDQAWTSGAVSGGALVGAVAGSNAGSIGNSVYWDQATSGQTAADGGGGGADTATAFNTGSDSPYARASYKNLDFKSDNGFVIVGGATRPFLKSEKSATILSLHQLQLVALAPNGDYTLVRDIDASPTHAGGGSDMWSNAGFVSIGSAARPFNGSLTGADLASDTPHTISGLYINTPAAAATGLFGVIGVKGSVSSLSLDNASITGGDATGALAGVNYGAVSGIAVTSTGAVTGGNDVGGVVGRNYGGVEGVNIAATISGAQDVGGVAGYSAAAKSGGAAYVADAVSSAIVNGAAGDVGGVVGRNDAGSSIFDPVFSGTVASDATGDSLGTPAAVSNYGGVAGYNAGSIIGADGVYTVDGAKLDILGGSNVGGVAGYNSGLIDTVSVNGAELSSYNTSVSTSPVTPDATNGLGGVVGYNDTGGVVRNVSVLQANLNGYAAPSSKQNDLGLFIITGVTNHVGGLIGENHGGLDGGAFAGVTSTNAAGLTTASGNVTGAEGVGGAVGVNYGAINNIEVHGSVHVLGADDIGGAVGWNATPASGSATLTNVHVGSDGAPYASEVSVVTNARGGGLVGYNDAGGIVSGSWANADVENTYGSSQALIGGLIGLNAGQVSTSYSAGRLFVRQGATFGGLIGENSGAVSDVYTYTALSNIVASSYVGGGLVGRNDATGRLSNAYVSSAAQGAATSPGKGAYFGLVAGANAGRISNVYYDGGLSTAQPIAQNLGGVAMTTRVGRAGRDAYAKSTYAGFDFNKTWYIADGSTRPILRAEYSTQISNGHQLQLMALDLTATYTLLNPIDLSGTQQPIGDIWRTPTTAAADGSWGFVPIGTAANPFTGSLFGTAGSSVTIDSLGMKRAKDTSVGLFGALGGYSLVSNITFTNAAIYGVGSAGVLAGQSAATVFNVDVVGSKVTGGDLTGGLVGSNAGTLTNVDVTGSTVLGANRVGGLAGWNTGEITTAEVGGTDVTGSGRYIGGVVGYNGGVKGAAAGVLTQLNSAYYYGGTVTATAANTENDVGGVAGYNAADGLVYNANASYNPGPNRDDGFTVMAAGNGAGGLVGRNDGDVEGFEYFGGVDPGGLVHGVDSVGGLIGINAGLIHYGNNFSNVSGRNNVGGGIGLNLGTALQIATGVNGSSNKTVEIGIDVTGETAVGGLVGKNSGSLQNSGAVFTNVYGKEFVGGLVGYNDAASPSAGMATITGHYTFESIISAAFGIDPLQVRPNVDNVTVNGTSTASGEADIGGLVGYNGARGTISDVAANNTAVLGSAAAGAGGSSNGGYAVGGLAGVNLGSIQVATVSNALVVGSQAVGGVAGRNLGSLSGVTADGTVVGDAYVGGVVGYNGSATAGAATAKLTDATFDFGTVYGYGLGGAGTEADTGGVVGYNAASGRVSGAVVGGSDPADYVSVGSQGAYTGGVIGRNAGSAASLVATGVAVEGVDGVGGLVGSNSGALSRGLIQDGMVDGADFVGGAVGLNAPASGGAASTASVDQFAARGVTITWNGQGQGQVFGGLVGRNAGVVTNSLAGVDASGAQTSIQLVKGMTTVGGFVGYNVGTVSTSYTTANLAAIGGASLAGSGGFAGNNQGTLKSDYFDTDTTHQSKAAGAGSGTGATGLSDAAAKKQASYKGFDFKTIWTMGTYPALQSEQALLAGLTGGQ